MNFTNPIPFDHILLIPCYNNLAGLVSSLKSIHYPGDRFSVVIVDDGSNIALNSEHLNSYLPLGCTIKIIRLPINRGITQALNEGLTWIKNNTNSRYISRLDCGDLCTEDRFTRQVSLLDENPHVNITGSWCYFQNYSTGARYLYKTPTRHRSIYRGMSFRNMFIHPTVMWRTDSLVKTGLYPSNFPHAEDYGFFYTLLKNGTGAIIPEPLVTCEINPGGISLMHRTEQLRSRIKVIKQFSTNKLLKYMGIVKLWILLAMPYSLILNTKKLLYGR